MGSMSYEHPVLEELGIRSLLCRERYYRDTAQWQKLRDCYHPDAAKTRVEISWYGCSCILRAIFCLLLPISDFSVLSLGSLGVPATLTCS